MKNVLSNILAWFARPAPVAQVPAVPTHVRSVPIPAKKQGVSFDEAFGAAHRPTGLGDARLAMDTACSNHAAMFAGSYVAGVFEEGLQFMGYPYLAQLTQRAEYRLISDIRAEEMTRKWIELKYSGEGTDADPDEASAKIEQLTKALDDYGVRDAFRKMVEHDGQFGRGHIYIDTGETNNPDELAKPFRISRAKIKKGGLRGFRNIEPMWVYPSGFDAGDPLKPDFYVPSIWYVNGKNVHRTRLLTMVSKPVPDILKPAYSFGGMSLTQLAKPYVDNWLKTRESVSDLIASFSVMVLETDLNTLTQNGRCADDLMARAEMFTTMRDNMGLWMVNKDTEGFSNVSAPLGSLDKLQAQSQEQVASVARLPLVKFTGITPSGLNATSDGEIRVFYDTINAEQERMGREPIQYMIECVQMDIWGEIDPRIVFEFIPLYQLSEKEAADMRKTEAETDTILIDNGTVSPEEARKRVSTEVGGSYIGIDVEAMPEPPEDDTDTDTDTDGKEA